MTKQSQHLHQLPEAFPSADFSIDASPMMRAVTSAGSISVDKRSHTFLKATSLLSETRVEQMI